MSDGLGMYYDRQGNRITLTEWAKAHEDFATRCVVAQHWIRGWMVSTVWLGIDHSHGFGGPPIIFETMIFAPDKDEGELHQDLDGAQWRYPNEAAALAGHDQALAMVRDEFSADAAEISASPEPQP